MNTERGARGRQVAESCGSENADSSDVQFRKATLGTTGSHEVLSDMIEVSASTE